MAALTTSRNVNKHVTEHLCGCLHRLVVFHTLHCCVCVCVCVCVCLCPNTAKINSN